VPNRSFSEGSYISHKTVSKIEGNAVHDTILKIACPHDLDPLVFPALSQPGICSRTKIFLSISGHRAGSMQLHTEERMLPWTGGNLGLKAAASASERPADPVTTRWRSRLQNKRSFPETGNAAGLQAR
jgi:hypothetical protein